ncbi:MULTISPECIES: B12-binding domain-containing radical SAM protein [unclassified Sedimentibacter]|uniref:B12-binding domain-containing radical SAM protein n=1 Tax=unclassified Sedimentibacter TaxID=2649220 RepID=UPI0027E1D305|nr:radical SAM protein [Sedimentibacter sp. MB35-C1]WMJ78986.1 radical SAM protein [Sedimentibacter sp. MB35-C1]
MKKILLIQPSPYDRDHKPIKKSRLYFVDLAMPLLAAMMPDDWEAEIVLEILEDIPWDTDADIIGISSMGHGVIRSLDIAAEFKKMGKTVILGGYMVSIMVQEATKYCDAVVAGDAELVWKELLSDYKNGKLKKIYEKNLEKGTLSTPLPRFDLIVNKKIGDFLPVQAGRGCPNTCSFCSVACLYKGHYIKKPLEEVVRDIKQVKDLGFKKFLLLDDNIFSDREYLERLLIEIKNLNMQWMSQCDIRIGRENSLLAKLAESGCTTLSFGLESISRESLIGMNKGWANPAKYPELIANIQSHNIDVSTEMVVGGDGDTLESIKATKYFIENNKISVPRFYILTPIPGTKFFDEIKFEGRLINKNIYSFDGTEAVHVPKNMTPEELTQAYWDLYESLFTYKSIVKRNIVRKEFLKNPGKYLFYCLVNLFYRYQIKKRITPNIF